MKKFLGIAFLTMFWLINVQAKEVELKGFKLGLNKKEFKQTWKSQRKLYDTFHYVTTLAGVNVDKPTVWWTKKPATIEAIQFKIYYNMSATLLCTELATCPNVIQPASNFVRVVEAIKNKFPGFKCTETDLMNKMGAKFVNRECVYHNGDGVSISTIRYKDNKELGTITILPTAWYKQNKKQDAELFKKDL
tara:strand:+ start:102 stop:674 length:573 start_codon:yes stop_codon:yes gene_type:complete